MEIDPRVVEQAVLYKLMIGCVVPRPIAWVSSLDGDGIRNLAPFSYFMAITDDPPTLAFSCSPRRSETGRTRKDTARNVEATREFVVNVVDDPLDERMNLSSGDYPPEVDEFALTGLTPAPGVRVRAPRIAEAPISMECRLDRIIPIGNGPSSLVLGQIVYFHVRDEVYDPATGRIDMHRLRPVGRLNAQLYTRVHDIFEMKRPSADYRG